MIEDVETLVPVAITTDPDWQRLVDAERELQALIADAREQARERVERARAAAAAALPDAAANEALAAQQERADVQRHREELARLADETQQAVRTLGQLPDERIDALARWVLDRAFDDAGNRR